MSKIQDKDLILAIQESREQGKPTETLGKMITYIANRYANWGQWKDPKFDHIRDDMIQNAIAAMLKHYVKFDESRSNSAFAYLTTIANCSFPNLVVKEYKQQTVVHDKHEYDNCEEGGCNE